MCPEGLLNVSYSFRAEWVDEYEGQVAKEVRYIVGTREYLSPEHLKYLATPKMDVWSIGFVCIQPPFHVATASS